MIVDSKKKKLSSEEIVKNAAVITKSPYTPEQVYAALVAEAYTPNTLLIREGNTLFVINFVPTNKSQGYFRALNSDTALNYLNNARSFIKVAGSIGFETLVVDFQDSSLLSLFKSISRRPPYKNMSYDVQDHGDQGYRVIIHLGDIPKKDHKQ